MADTRHIQSAFLSYVQPGDRVFRGLDTDFRGAEERPEGTVLFRGTFYDDEDREQTYAIVKYRGVEAPEVVYRGGAANLQPTDGAFEAMLARKEGGYRGVADATVESLSARMVALENRVDAQLQTVSDAFRGLSADVAGGEARFAGLLQEQFAGVPGQSSASVVNA